MNYEEARIRTGPAGEGFSLYYQAWRVSSPKTILIFVHGLGEHSGRYKNLVTYFSPRNYTLYGYDQRGHGKSPGPRAHVDRFDLLLEDLDQLIRFVRKNEQCQKLFVIGHSFGGQVLLNYCLDFPGNMDGAIFSSPNIRVAFPISPLKVRLAHFVDRFFPELSLPNDLNPDHISHDPAVVKAYTSDPLVSKKITVRLGKEILDNQAVLMNRAGQFDTPSLFLHAGDDKICSRPATEEFFDKIPISDKVLKTYDGFYHELFNEIGQERVFGDIERWLEQKLKL
ncbi:MAG: lysophospholipase [Deltaproteobacteria bacterium]|nr:lysophospholipase [Deltaproteobacteria bacterium]